MIAAGAQTAWASGRLDGARGPSQLLFGRMYEDSRIELEAFAAGSRVFCIASAGCLALDLSSRHEVDAVDINPAQAEYARRRAEGFPARPGVAERLLGAVRSLAPAAGWSSALLRAFLDLQDPAEQAEFWRNRLDTRRFRAALDILVSRPALSLAFSPRLTEVLPKPFGPVLRARLERCVSRHPNRTNPYARALFLGEFSGSAVPLRRPAIHHADAADFLEAAPEGAYGGFSLSNILDGAEPAYARRLRAAVRRAAAPGAAVVLRSFREPDASAPADRAAEDRSMLWGRVHVGPARDL